MMLKQSLALDFEAEILVWLHSGPLDGSGAAEAGLLAFLLLYQHPDGLCTTYMSFLLLAH